MVAPAPKQPLVSREVAARYPHLRAETGKRLRRGEILPGWTLVDADAGIPKHWRKGEASVILCL